MYNNYNYNKKKEKTVEWNYNKETLLGDLLSDHFETYADLMGTLSEQHHTRAAMQNIAMDSFKQGILEGGVMMHQKDEEKFITNKQKFKDSALNRVDHLGETLESDFDYVQKKLDLANDETVKKHYQAMKERNRADNLGQQLQGKDLQHQADLLLSKFDKAVLPKAEKILGDLGLEKGIQELATYNRNGNQHIIVDKNGKEHKGPTLDLAITRFRHANIDEFDRIVPGAGPHEKELKLKSTLQNYKNKGTKNKIFNELEKSGVFGEYKSNRMPAMFSTKQVARGLGAAIAKRKADEAKNASNNNNNNNNNNNVGPAPISQAEIEKIIQTQNTPTPPLPPSLPPLPKTPISDIYPGYNAAISPPHEVAAAENIRNYLDNPNIDPILRRVMKTTLTGAQKRTTYRPSLFWSINETQLPKSSAISPKQLFQPSPSSGGSPPSQPHPVVLSPTKIGSPSLLASLRNKLDKI